MLAARSCAHRFDQETSALFKKKGIKALPVMQIIAGSRGAMEPFVCGPSKVARLVSKLGETTSTGAPSSDEAVDKRPPATAPEDAVRLPT